MAPTPTPTPTPDVPVTNTHADKAKVNSSSVISTGQSTFIGDNTVFTDNLSNGIQTYLPVLSTSQVHSKGFRVLAGTTNNYFASDNLKIDCCGNFFSAGTIDISGSILAYGTASFANNKFKVDASGAVIASNGLFKVDRFGNVDVSGNLSVFGTSSLASGKFIVDASGNMLTQGSLTSSKFKVDKNGNVDASGNLSLGGTVSLASGKFTVDASGAIFASNGLFTADRLGVVTARSNFVSQTGDFSTTGGSFTTTGAGGFSTSGSGNFSTSSGNFTTVGGYFDASGGSFTTRDSGGFTTNGGSGNFATGSGSFTTNSGNLSTTTGDIVGKNLVINNGNNYLTLDSKTPLLRFNNSGFSSNNGTFIIDSSSGVINTFGTISSTGAITSSGALTGARLSIGMDASNNANFTIDSTGAITTQNYTIANSGSANFANGKFMINQDGSISASNNNFVVDSSGSIIASKNIGASGTASFLGGNFTVDSINGIKSNNNFVVDVSGNMNKVGNIVSQGGLSTTQSMYVGGTDVNGANIILSNNGISNFKQGVTIGKSSTGYNFVVDSNGNLTTQGTTNLAAGNFTVDGSGNMKALNNNFTVDSTNGIQFYNNKFAVDLSGDIVAAGNLNAAGSLNTSNFSVNTNGDIITAGTLKTSKFAVDALGNVDASGNIVGHQNLTISGSANLLNNNFTVDSTNGIKFYNNKFVVDLSGDIVAAGSLNTSNFSVNTNGAIVAAGSLNTSNFSVDVSGAIVAAGSLKTSKFAVDALGNVDASGNLSTYGSASLADGKLKVDASGNMMTEGSLKSSKFTVDALGNVDASGNLSAYGPASLAAGNFKVDASGDIVAAGSLKTSKFTVDRNGNIDASGNLSAYGPASLAAGNFKVDASGDIVAAGSLKTSKFTVDRNGNVDASGNLSVGGTVSLASGKFTLDDNGIGFFNKHVTTNTAFSDYTLPLSITDDFYTYYDPTKPIPAQDVSAMTSLFETPTNNRFTTQEYVDKVLFVQTARINNLVGPDASAALQQLASYQKLIAAIDGTTTANIINSLNTSNYELLNTISNTISTGYNPILINCVPSIWGSQCPPRPIPTPITQSYFQDGWFFANQDNDNVINWYLPASSNLKLGSIKNLFINIFAVSNISVPSISILTNRGQITYSFNTSSSIYTDPKSQTAYKPICLYTNDVPSNIYNGPSGEFPFTSATSFLYSASTSTSTLNLIQSRPTSFQTSYPQLPVMNSTDIVEYFCIQTSVTTNNLDVMFILQSFNISTSDGTTKMLFKNSDVVNNYIMNKFFKQYTDFSSTSNNNELQVTSYADYFNNVVNNTSLASSTNPPSNFNTNITVKVNNTTTLINPIASVVNVGSSTTSVPIVITPDSTTNVITATLTNNNETNVSISLTDISGNYSATISNLLVGDNTVNITSRQSSTNITSLFSIVIHRYSNDSSIQSIQVFSQQVGRGSFINPTTGFISSSGTKIVGAASTGECTLASGSLIKLQFATLSTATITVATTSSAATYKIAYPHTGSLVSPIRDGEGNLNLVTSNLGFGNNFVRIVTTAEEPNSPSTLTGYINLYVLKRETTTSTFQVKTKSSPVTYINVTSGNTVDIDSSFYNADVSSIMNVAATSGTVGAFSVQNSSYGSPTVNGNIAYGLNTVTFTITAEDTRVTQSYSVNVYCTSTVTTLSNLMIGGVSSINGTPFASLPNNSTINLAPTTTSVQIVATPTSSIGTVKINDGNYNASSTFTVSSLTPGSTSTLTIIVKSSQTNSNDLNYIAPSTLTYTYKLNVQDTNLDSLYYDVSSSTVASVNNNQITFDPSNNASVTLTSTGVPYQKFYLKAIEEASGNTLTYDLSNNVTSTLNNPITSNVTFEVSLAGGFNYINIKDTSVDGNYNQVYNLAVNNTSNDISVSSASWINADMSGALVIGSPNSIQLDVSGIVTLSATPTCPGAAINMYTLDASNNYTGTVVNQQINVDTGATVQVGMFTTALNGTTTYPLTPQVTASFVGPAPVSSEPVMPVITSMKYSFPNNPTLNDGFADPNSDFVIVPSTTNTFLFTPQTTTLNYTIETILHSTNGSSMSIVTITNNPNGTATVVVPHSSGDFNFNFRIKDANNNESDPYLVKIRSFQSLSFNTTTNKFNDDNYGTELNRLTTVYNGFPTTVKNSHLTAGGGGSLRTVSQYISPDGNAIALLADYSTTSYGSTPTIGNTLSNAPSTGAVLTALIYNKNTYKWEPYVISGFGTSSQYVSNYNSLGIAGTGINTGMRVRQLIINSSTNLFDENTVFFSIQMSTASPYTSYSMQSFVAAGYNSSFGFKSFSNLAINSGSTQIKSYNATNAVYDTFSNNANSNYFLANSLNNSLFKVNKIEIVGIIGDLTQYIVYHEGAGYQANDSNEFNPMIINESASMGKITTGSSSITYTAPAVIAKTELINFQGDRQGYFDPNASFVNTSFDKNATDPMLRLNLTSNGNSLHYYLPFEYNASYGIYRIKYNNVSTILKPLFINP